MVYVLVYMTFPVDRCEALSDLALTRSFNIVMAFSHCFVFDSLVAVSLSVYIHLFVRPHMFLKDTPAEDFACTLIF